MKNFKGCKECVYADESENGEHCGRCVHNAVNNFRQMTNGDEIRDMRNPVLAEFIVDVKNNVDSIGIGCRNCKVTDKYVCINCVWKWLEKRRNKE